MERETPHKLVSAILVGFLSGFMVYMMLWLLFLGPSTLNGSPYSWFVLAWAISSFGVFLWSDSVLTVWARGALVGAVEWLASSLTALFIYMELRGDSSQMVLLGGKRVGAEIESGIVPMVAIGGSLAMAVVCVILWFTFNNAAKNQRGKNATNATDTADSLLQPTQQPDSAR